MSKFFRTSSVDSSSSETSDGSPDGVEDLSRVSGAQDPSVNNAAASLDDLSLATRTPGNGWQSQMLLHALLEERCINQVRREQESKPRRQRLDENGIRTEASARYQRLCSMLAPHNLISSGLEHDGLSATRERYRDGLDVLSSTSMNAESQRQNVPAPMRRLLTDRETPQLSTSAPHALQLASSIASDTSSVMDSLSPAHALLEPSRFARDFDQLGVLGKGGYGTVYRVKHKLDSMQYAVKIVPISAARMARIRARGQAELDELLLEVHTLAKLEHPNIVRYYGGWIEWSNVDAVARPADASSLFSGGVQTRRVWSDVSGESDAVPGADESSSSLDRVVTQSDSEGTGIVFESSLSQDNFSAVEPSKNTHQASLAEESAPGTFNSDISDFASPVPGPALALHIQMALYPLTLADYLLSDGALGTIPRHCFHLHPSLSIMHAILDGVEYLHSEDIVHRDLKPANIFLAEHRNPRTTRDSINPMLCDSCRGQNHANTTTLKVRIGDFGLVTAMAQPEHAGGSQGAAVGTEIYRPTATVSHAPARLDIYALGIVFFELIWPFSTRMERQDTINRLKHGKFPTNFSSCIGEKSDKVESCIRSMLSVDEENLAGESPDVTIATLREQLKRIER